MTTSTASLRLLASALLILATVFWGVSFPVMKAIGLIQQDLLPGANSWFLAASAMVIRFGLAALIMLVWCWPSLGRMTRLELIQGAGLGFFSGTAMVLQVDGLIHTSASVSAFLTQSYCLFLPGLAALQRRQWPSPLVWLCSALVMMGIAILAQIDWTNLHMGRGEFETLISSFFFAAQILWLERPAFTRNRVSHFSLVMFATMALVAAPVALVCMRSGSDWTALYTSTSVLALTAVLVLLCTMISFVLMNRWQPFLPAPEAALIYAAEPVFASLFALVLPAWISFFAGINYPNERATNSLLLGGGFITLANILVQIRALMSGNSSPPVAAAAESNARGALGSCDLK